MPVCSDCKRSLGRDAFTKAQLKKKRGEPKRCRACAEALEAAKVAVGGAGNDGAVPDNDNDAVAAAAEAKKPEEPKCAGCGKNEDESKSGLRSCTNCKRVLYCSRECQIMDWKNGHKSWCKDPVFAEWSRMFLCRSSKADNYRHIPESLTGGDWLLPPITILKDVDEISLYDAPSLLLPLLQSVAPVLTRGWLSRGGNFIGDVVMAIIDNDGQVSFSDYLKCLPDNIATEYDADVCFRQFFEKGGIRDDCKYNEDDGEDTISEEICPICFERFRDHSRDFRNLYRLPCSHAFHHNCLQMWRDSNPDARTCCPQCQAPLPTETIARSIMVPNSKLLKGNLIEFNQIIPGRKNLITWAVRLPQGMKEGDIIKAELSTDGHPVQPEPSSTSLQSAMIQQKLAEQKRGALQKTETISHKLDADPRYFLSTRLTTCKDCGIRDSYEFVDRFEAFDRVLCMIDEDRVSFEQLLDSQWVKGPHCDGCTTCKKSSRCGWRYDAGFKAWCRDESKNLKTDSVHTTFMVTLPPVLTFHLLRHRRKKQHEGTAMNFTRIGSHQVADVEEKYIEMNFTTIDLPQVLDVDKHIPHELKKNLPVPVTTKYNLRFMILRLALEEVDGVWGPIPRGRYVYNYRSLIDQKWYRFDLCRGKPKPLTNFDGVDRINSRFVYRVVYVRQDLDIDNSL